MDFFKENYERLLRSGFFPSLAEMIANETTKHQLYILDAFWKEDNIVIQVEDHGDDYPATFELQFAGTGQGLPRRDWV